MKLSKHISHQKGFTLVELLIVVGILAVLALGLLAALNPLDQLRRGRDSSRRGVAVEVANGFNRYQAQRQVMPWGTGGATFGPAALTDGVGSLAIASLILQNEVKTGFIDGVPTAGGNTNAITIYSDSALNTYVCFRQEAFGVNIADIYANATGGTSTVCADGAGTTACFFCAR